MNLRKVAKYAVIPVGLLASGLIVQQASSAAFTAQTRTEANSWTTGTVALTNDHVSTAAFTETGLVPGATGSKTIKVDYDGDVKSAVKFYTVGGGSDVLAQALDVTVKLDGTTLYSGKLAGLAPIDTFGEGLGTWTPTGDASKNYVISWSVPDNAPQGATTSVAFAWESQTTQP